MSWTDERVELLRKLWNQGLSASQIATELANGITRNAVIGKVHRLGLSGRAKAPSSQAARPRKITRAPSHPLTHSANRAGLGSYSSAAAGQAAIRGNLALSPSPVTAEAVAPVVAYDPEPSPMSLCRCRNGSRSWNCVNRPAAGLSAIRLRRSSASAVRSRQLERLIAPSIRALRISLQAIVAKTRRELKRGCKQSH